MQPTLSDLIPGLDEILDPYEECAILCSTKPDNRDLGYYDKTATIVEVSIGSKDYTIHQSPTLLNSARTTGTTGAVLWKVTPLIAQWMDNADNPIRKSIIQSTSTVLELGSGTSGLLALSLGPRITKFIASDQEYCLKILQKNLTENLLQMPTRSRHVSSKNKSKRINTDIPKMDVFAIALDWETSSVAHHPAIKAEHFDAVFACDCIYNEALVPSFIDTLVDVCSMSGSISGRVNEKEIPTLVIIAQEIRSPDVLETFLTMFCKRFHVGRVPDTAFHGMRVDELKEGGGYVVHIGVLRRKTIN